MTTGEGMGIKRNTGNPDNQTQHDRFKQLARELGCDEDEAAFRDKLRVIARQKPKDDTPKKAPRRAMHRESK